MGYLRRFLRDHRPSPAMVVASIALLAALGGTSVAAVATLPNNSVGTSKIKNNAVTTPKIRTAPQRSSRHRTAKIASNAVTNAKIANGTIQPADLSAAAKTSGPAGAPGPQGPSGPAGAAAAAGWASVDANGTLVRNKSAASAQRNATGQYQVVFNQDVTGCSYLVVAWWPDHRHLRLGRGAAGQLPNVAAGVRVFTINPTGAAFKTSAFFVAVFC